MMRSLVVSFFVVLLSGCSNPQPGPDKTIGGAVLGAGWGAGAGAIIGNQAHPHHPGEGAAIGAGFGLVEGAMTGAAYDLTEETQIRQENELASLKIQNTTNARQLEHLQDKLDHLAKTDAFAAVYQVYFDPDATNLRSGAVSDLETLAEAIKKSPSAMVINVDGHSDDAGTPDYNQRLSESRARNVSSYLGARGISMNQITVRSFGSTRPIASNSTPEGRQLNRRVEVYTTPQ